MKIKTEYGARTVGGRWGSTGDP